jgi:hypothetical protein
MSRLRSVGHVRREAFSRREPGALTGSDNLALVVEVLRPNEDIILVEID